jgi:hypothetical protein
VMGMPWCLLVVGQPQAAETDQVPAPEPSQILVPELR